ncbi:translesion DNA synthesis-associated protein ImuA [Thiohalobacter sp.]|uniref:translesion DNA synthesis-associated protein ImuA n=1 Tax=Thiohalobacter sp. TaxID=2025948 RepID=UPI002616F925|nr:translesion DNA synthesis-associated protein ImuA [Thiohalobacter sp.]
MNPELERVLARRDVWRGRNGLANGGKSIATGLPELDALLPGGGWPRGALTELLLPREGIGALQLLMPALAQLSREQRWTAWVAPPYIPYAPALAAAGVDLSRQLMIHPRADGDGLWALEQTLRSGTCGAVLAWPMIDDARRLRRLQLAAEAGNCWGILFRPLAAADRPSPAAVRLQVTRVPEGLQLQVLKRRGGWAAGPLAISFERLLPQALPACHA